MGNLEWYPEISRPQTYIDGVQLGRSELEERVCTDRAVSFLMLVPHAVERILDQPMLLQRSARMDATAFISS